MNIKIITQGPISTNTYLVMNNDECLIIDPELTAGSIINIISEFKLTPKAILLTHGHFDHIGAVIKLREHYSIPVYASEVEIPLLLDSSLNLSQMVNGHYSIEVNKTIEDDELLNLIGLDIRCILTPGHTSGSMCYLIEDCLFSGDTLFEESYGRYDFPTGSLSDLRKSIKKLLQLDEKIKVYPGHGNVTSIEHERKYNPLR
ncbi:MAG: MBL fold metallo-hydrolase [Erysipelotrichales bacterium]|nr:MBL fold metallo-hydrolase [Erysipelotrichales bacterium]